MYARLLIGTLLALATMACGAETIYLINGTIVDPSRSPPQIQASIVIEANRIQHVGHVESGTIPDDATVVDLSGKFIIPGLIDTHNHLFSGSEAAQWDPGAVLEFLPKWGITTVFDTAVSMATFEKLKKEGQSKGTRARFFGVGRSLGARDGWGGTLTGGFTPATEAEARLAVQELATANVDGIKVVYDDMSVFGVGPWPMLDEVVLRAIIDEAHEHSLKAYVHAPKLEYAKVALRMGADVLIHGIISDPVDEEFIQLMRNNHAYYVPTHILYEQGANQPAMSTRYESLDRAGLIDRSTYKLMWESRKQNATTGPMLPTLRENLRIVANADIPIAMGSDTGVPGVLAGVASQMEIILYVESAMTPLEALRSATSVAAELIGQDTHLGSIEPSKYADLVILELNPLDDIRNISRIWGVIVDGKFAFAPALTGISNNQ